MIAKNSIIANTDGKVFSEQLTEAIDIMQKEGLTVEVHYQVTALGNYSCVYSALLLGRSKGE